MSSDESAHGAQSLLNWGLSSTVFSEVQGKTPQLWIADPPQNNLCHWCTRPSPTKAQPCSSVNNMSLHFDGMNYISISKAFTPTIFRTSCRMILLPDIESEQVKPILFSLSPASTKKGRKASVWRQITKKLQWKQNKLNGRKANPQVLCWWLSLSPAVERPASPHCSLVILQLEPGNPP